MVEHAMTLDSVTKTSVVSLPHLVCVCANRSARIRWPSLPRTTGDLRRLVNISPRRVFFL